MNTCTVAGSTPATTTSVKTITLAFIFIFIAKLTGPASVSPFLISHNNKNLKLCQAPRERRLFFNGIYNPQIFTIMKQNKRDFLEAIGFEGNERDMVKQMLFGIGVGMAFIFMLGVAEVIGDWIVR